MVKLRRFLRALLLFFMVLSLPCYAQVYEITESELLQIEQNTQRIEQALSLARQELEKSEKALEVSQSKLTLLETQIQAQAKLLQESEEEKKKLINIGIPAISATVVIVFIGGIVTGAKIGK
jgi:septal ring factor EnvC (AmiA/AmiB activator)